MKTTRKKIHNFIIQSPIHAMFVWQAIQHYADGVLANKEKLLAEENKHNIINPQSLLVVAQQAKTLI